MIPRHGTPDVFALREAADPTPGEGDIRIRVRAAGVNFADILARLGLYPDAPKPPLVVGYEVAGVVDAVGAGVTAFREGDRVVALTRFGGYADVVVVPAIQGFKFPDSLSDAEAAAVPVTYLTAALALYRMAAVSAGETVLVHNAGGGLGIAATQLARLRRATVFGTASAAKHDALRSFGVEQAIDYRHADVAAEIDRLTRGRGVDVIIDPIGGSSFAASYRMLAPLGRLVMLGVSSMAGETRRPWRVFRSWWAMKPFDALSLINRNRGVFGLNLGHLWDERRTLQPLMDAAAERAERRPPGTDRRPHVPARPRRRGAPLHPGPIEHRQSHPDDVSRAGRGSRRTVLVAVAAIAALTAAYTWPLLRHPGSSVAHDTGDPLLVTWLLAWDAHVVPLTRTWWNAPAFFPSAGVTAFSETFLGEAPISTPVIWATGSAVLGYNAAFLFSYLACGMGAYLLAFVLTDCAGASFVAALAFAFAPYRLSHLQHLQLLSSYWMPVALAALHQYVEQPRPRWAAVFAAAWLLQALACGYYLFFLSVFVGLWLIAFAPGKLKARELAWLGSAWMAAALLLLPVLLGYHSIQSHYGFHRSPVEIDHYSADIAGLWSAAPESLFFHRLAGTTASESLLFPGLTVTLTAAVALFAPRRQRPMVFYLSAAAIMWALALGPHPMLHGRPIGLSGPYGVLALLPGFDGIRVPARFWMLSVLSLSIVAALVDRTDCVAARTARCDGAGVDRHRARRLAQALPRSGRAADGRHRQCRGCPPGPAAARNRGRNDVRGNRRVAAGRQRLQRI